MTPTHDSQSRNGVPTRGGEHFLSPFVQRREMAFVYLILRISLGFFVGVKGEPGNESIPSHNSIPQQHTTLWSKAEDQQLASIATKCYQATYFMQQPCSMYDFTFLFYLTIAH